MTAVGFRFLTFVVIIAFAAACTSSGGSPSPSPTPPGTTSSGTTSPEPSPSEPLTTGPNVRPGEKPPEFPALARRRGQIGALAFTAYYYKAFDWSYATNDSYLLRRLALRSCRGCTRVIRSLDRLRTRNEVLTGGRIRLRSARVDHREFDFPSDFVVDVELDEQPVVLDAPSAAPSTVAPRLRSHHSLVFLRWIGQHWRVADVTGR